MIIPENEERREEFAGPLPNDECAMATTDPTGRTRAHGLLLAAALLAGCAPKATPSVRPATQTVGGLTVQMTVTAPAPPHTGDDTLNLTITSAAGAPVGDANVTATPDMLAPREPGQSNSGRAQGNGLYQVPMRLPIATRYDVEVQIQQRDGQPPVTVSFPLEAAQ